jgi:PAS domain S-box-containing protein
MFKSLLKKITGFLSSIIGQNQSYAALKESENRYRVLFESINDAILVCDFGRGFLDVNSKAMSRYGYTKKEFLGLKPMDIVAPDYTSELSNFMEEVHKKGQMVCESVHLGHDGTQFPVEISSRVINYNGTSAVASIVREISQRKQAEEEIRKSERLTGVLEMAGTVCHELNQPLQAILGYSQLLLFDIDVKDPLYDKAEKIIEQVNRMNMMNSKLMKVTEYETKYYLEEKIIDIDKASMKRQ